jgi:hypothetical protein
MFSNHTRFQVRDGSKIKFWHDLWHRDKAIKEAFPNLYSIPHMKDAFIAVHLELSNGSHQWT